MNMTHYMELLAVNQPWNLIFFMAIPVGLAETVVITELYILFTRRTDGWVRWLNRWAGIVVGAYFLGVIVYLLTTAVIPITIAGQWRTALDVIAVGAYLLGGIPLVLVAFQELGVIQRHLAPEQKLRWHATFVAAFLILGHIAMIVGMTDPGLLGYSASHDARMEHSMPAEANGHTSH
jgi:hypothetical protein